MKASYNWLKEYCEFDAPAHELAERLSHAGLGVETLEPVGDDYLLDFEVKSNRPDCLSHVGIAREIAAVTGGTARLPEFDLQEDPAQGVADAASVEVAAPDLCPHYTARVIRGVKIAPSPQWLQQRLTVCGVRPINNVVDVTNYVLLECGQPLHAFDLALLGGGRIVVRRPQPGETITTIDGAEHALTGEECVIADAAKPIALAGVMGGIESEVSEATADILLESARFDPHSTRRTSRAHGLASESAYRFERGVDPEMTDWASRRACQLILEVAGGTLLKGVAEVRTDAAHRPEVLMRFGRLRLVLGIEVPREEVLRILGSLGLDVLREDEEAVTVRAPTWRADLSREIDLIEEVARVHGYDRIAETTRMSVQAVVPSVQEVAERRARHMLAGQGFCQVMAYSLVQPTDLQRSQPWHDGEPIAVRNPVTADRTHLRLTNMANLLLAKRFNAAHGTPQVELFELGRVYLPRRGAQLPEEKLCLTLLTDHADGARRLKGVLANLLDELGVESGVAEQPGGRGPFQAGESVELRMGDALLGCTGVVAEQVAQDLDLPNRPALLEVDFGLLVERCRLAPAYRPVPPYPSTNRDLAVVVDEAVLWAQLEQCVRAHAPDTLESLELFDVYRGDPVPPGRKSVAFSLTFRLRDGTITADQAEDGRAAILDGLKAEFGAELR